MSLSDYQAQLIRLRHALVCFMLTRSAAGRPPRPADRPRLLSLGLLLRQGALFTRNERLAIVQSIQSGYV